MFETDYFGKNLNELHGALYSVWEYVYNCFLLQIVSLCVVTPDNS